MDQLVEIAALMDTGLSKNDLEVIKKVLDTGVSPDAIISELQKSRNAGSGQSKP